MEKRTLIAVALSLFILFSYNSLIMRYQAAHPDKFKNNNTQVIANKEVTVNKQEIIPSSEQTVQTAQVVVAESLQRIETDKLIVEISNIGGNIKDIALKDFKQKFYLENLFSLAGYENSVFILIKEDNNRVSCSFENEDYEIRKIYEILPGSYGINVSVNIKNKSKMSKLNKFKISSFTLNLDSLEKDHGSNRDKSLFEYAIKFPDNIFRKGNAFSFNKKEYTKKAGIIEWTGFRNRYFCFVAKPEFKTDYYFIEPIGEKEARIGVEVDRGEIKPGERVSYQFKAYAGPQDEDLLAKYEPNFAGLVSFSNFGIIDTISKWTVKSLKFLNGIIHNTGVCIILVSIGFYLAMYPLTLKGMGSMRKMQLLQPEIARIREQYKNNPQKMNTEVMGLYKKNKVNPFGGCFPFLLQMPVFIGLYQALWRSFYLKGGSFLWIKDLSEPDRLYIFKYTLPIIGNELNILPIIMMAVMFLQQKLSSMNMKTTDPSQLMQQKMMGIFFPIFLGFIFYGFSSGITLYFTVFYSLSTITQWKMSKMNGTQNV